MTHLTNHRKFLSVKLITHHALWKWIAGGLFIFWAFKSYGTNIFVLVKFYVNEFFFNLRLIIDDLAKIIYQILN